MDRKNYDDKVIAIFDNIGSFFVDTFYNGLYLKARDLVKTGRAGSITDAYRANVINYMKGIEQRPDLYISVVKKLHEYYQKSSGFGAVVFSEFEDKVLSQFIPREYYRDFTEKHKDSTLHEIIVRTVSDLGEIILQKDLLKRVIDDHMNSANVQILQDKMMDVLITQREDYYGRFVQEINKTNGNDKVSKKVLDKLKAAFVEETKTRVDVETERDRAVSIISQLMKKIAQLESEVAKLKVVIPERNDIKSPGYDIMGDLNDDSAIIKKRTRVETPRSPKAAEVKKPVVIESESDSDPSDDEMDDAQSFKYRRQMIEERRAQRAEPAPSTLTVDDDPWA